MAELIQTEEEKNAALWSDLSDDALGKSCKAWLSNIDDLLAQEDEVRKFLLLIKVVLGHEGEAINWSNKSGSYTINLQNEDSEVVRKWQVIIKPVQESNGDSEV